MRATGRTRSTARGPSSAPTSTSGTAWLERDGHDPADFQPAGRTHTIAELRQASLKARVKGRIHAAYIREAGLHVLVGDETGQLQVACRTMAMVLEMRKPRVKEIEVSLPPLGEPVAEIGKHRPWPPLKVSHPTNWSADAKALSVRPIPGAPQWHARTANHFTTAAADRTLHTDGRVATVVFARLRLQPLHCEPPERGSLVDFADSIYGLLDDGIPPRVIINDLLAKGERPFELISANHERAPGCRWEPFQITEADFDALVTALQARGTRQPPFDWGSYELADPPADVATWEGYLAWRSEPKPLILWLPPVVREVAEREQALFDRVSSTGDTRAVDLAQDRLWAIQQRVAQYIIARWWIHRTELRDEMRSVMEEGCVEARAMWAARQVGNRKREAAHRPKLAAIQREFTAVVRKYPARFAERT